MVSRSYLNLVDLVSADRPRTSLSQRILSQPITFTGVLSNGDGNRDENSDTLSVEDREKKIIVANFLPLDAKKDPESRTWRFRYDDDSLLLQMKDGFSSDSEVFYVGSLKVEVDVSEQDEVSQKLLKEFNCIPVFIPTDLYEMYYHSFCKQHLWPVFHYMLPMCPDNGCRFHKKLWQAYISVNKIFRDRILEILNQESDLVWVHDYHLLVLPTLLRRYFHRVKLGFFLHSPFPSSEIFRTLPVRDEILKAMLNCDLLGFHTFDYARHFLSCCSRMLGLDYESKRGHIGLDYYGRTVYLKILPVGIHMRRLEDTLNHSSSLTKVKEVKEQFEGKKIILGVDDMDIFKGISLKISAMEHLLQSHPEWHGKLVLVQIVNPARTVGRDVEETKREMHMATEKINNTFGVPGYKPVVLIEEPLPIYEKTAYYALADCCIVNAVRDGMNLTPYNYVVCRQGTQKMNKALEIDSDAPRTSALVVSEFVGCSPSLSGAIRVNPWDIDAVGDAIHQAISMGDLEKQLRHEKHFQYVSSHDVAYWANSFMQDLERACKDHNSKSCSGLGFGFGFRVLSLSPSFKRLSREHVVSAYKRTSRRAIFLDYDGTVVPPGSILKTPGPCVVSIVNALCTDPGNTVFIVSGRGTSSLSEWFAGCENLGIAAEHGYLLRWNSSSNWESSSLATDFDWKRMAEPVMQLYTDATDGSYIEAKESALVWHHQDSDPAFGSCQAKELLDHLENVLANEPVIVTRGQQIVEVKPQGVTKGLVVEKILSAMAANGEVPDFVMCIGDDRSDEDMFERITKLADTPSFAAAAPEIFACTVGQKPSKATYYLDDISDVLKLLDNLGDAAAAAAASLKSSKGSVEAGVEATAAIAALRLKSSRCSTESRFGFNKSI